MRKTFQYRIYPTRAQETVLEKTLEECRWLYNHCLAERKNSWEEKQQSISKNAQHASLPGLKTERTSLSSVHSQVLQNVVVRVDLAFQHFFRRVKNREKPGYPRFRGYGRYDSITYPQYEKSCRLDGDHLHLSKIGAVKIVLHRSLEGTPKTVSIKRSSTGKWYVSFSCEWEPTALSKNDQSVGIDVGLSTFATLSNGEKIDNPRFFKREEKALAKAQRRLSKAEKGSRERKRRRKVVARVHERTRFKRKNFAHQESRRIVNRFGTICVEDLSVKRMIENGHRTRSKSIADAAWSDFLQMIGVKAEWAGRQFVKINPAYTSQDCSTCGQRQEIDLSVRIYNCPRCQVVLDRDLNAALNILRVGLHSLGIQSVEAPVFLRGE